MTHTLPRRHLQVKKASEPCKRARELVRRQTKGICHTQDTTHLPVWPRLSLSLSVFGFGLVLRVVVGPCFLGGFSCRSFGFFPRGFFLVFAFFKFFPLFLCRK